MKMRKKIFVSYLVIIVIAVMIATFSFWNRGYEFFSGESETKYLRETELLGDLLESKRPDKQEEYDKFVDYYSGKYGVRITLIDKNGDVLSDSGNTKTLENHLKREEVKRALNGEHVSLSRYSNTMHQTYCYSAIPVEFNSFHGVLRISVPMAEIKALNQNLVHAIILSVIFCFLIALVIALFFTKFLTEPVEEITQAAERISEGNYDTVIKTKEKGELGRLASSFNLMTKNLKSTMDNLIGKNIELEAVFRSMNGGVVAIDSQNNIMFYNQAFSKLANKDEQELTGRSFYNEVYSEAIYEAVKVAKENQIDEVKEGKWNGKRIRATAAPLVGEDEILGILILVEDITKLKKLEHMRSDFVSNVTHELKTPLTSIRGFVDTLKNGAIDDPKVSRKFLDIIDIETERLYSLIQDILLLSEIESKQDFEIQPCNITKVVKEVVDLLEPKFKENLKLNYVPEPYIRPYYCNASRIKELLINLLDNAIKYTEEGSVTLICKEDGDDLLIQVSDTGIGIEQKYLSRIFERFYRVDKGRSRKQGGTGLGLSIVKHIVELYNGRIKVESKVSEGTMFEIRLPYNN